ncbi:hypothetical protein P775_17315 [Puniceibacterium antarcticum]|uniref:Acetyltransferase n=1 Tax=Puniceibacterium antarcticum TaxID=1206336 RepID=A0A2G8RBK5_9RHOB|nr:acyltransferase [Puniceibacterium antarcticum]PIL18927.1 hypothetical protein P775_17315 [Puniceibacterium antarcticum]
MAFRYTGRYPDSFLEAVQRYGLLATCRTRLRDIFLLVRRLYLVKVWKMDIHPYTLVSLKAVLDRTYPQGVHIGEGSAVNFDAVILTHDMASSKRLHTRVGRYCGIGARCILLPGVTVGDHAIVAAGAIVTKDVPSHTIVAGNPARIIRIGIMTTNFGRMTDKGKPPEGSDGAPAAATEAHTDAPAGAPLPGTDD